MVDMARASPTASPVTAPQSQVPILGLPTMPLPPLAERRDICSGMGPQQQHPLAYLPFNVPSTSASDESSFLRLFNIEDDIRHVPSVTTRNTDVSSLLIPKMGLRGAEIGTFCAPAGAEIPKNMDGQVKIPLSGLSSSRSSLPVVKTDGQSGGNSSRGGSKTGATTRTPRNKTTGRFMCQTCKTTYGRHDNLMRHVRLECGKEALFHCPLCEYSAKRKFSLIRHLRRTH